MSHSSPARLIPLALTAALTAALVACGPEPAPELPTLQGAYEEGPPLAAGKADGLDIGALPAYGALPQGAQLDSALQALFAPDDPVVTLELKLINEVVAARKADTASSTVEGQNPYRVRYVVYNLRNPQIVAALADAEQAGVDVQVLIEADQLDPARSWNTADEQLVQRGFSLVADHRTLDAATRVSADLIGIKRSGLMHLKARLYETPARRRLLTGSMNPGDNAVANEETLHLINDPALIARYAAAYDAVLRAAPLQNQWSDAAAVNVLFTPAASGERAGTRVLRWLEAEQEQILLMVFSLRDVTAPGVSRSLVQILADKAAAGVPVYVITDRKQSDGVDADGNKVYWNDKTEDRLRAAGVKVYEATNRATPYTAMHHKVAVLGRTSIRVITDAANWTAAGLGSKSKLARNVESVLFIDSDRLDGGRTGRRYLAQWVRVLSRYAEQSAAADGEAGFSQALAALTAAPGWPAMPVSFTAHQAQTAWGETVRVRGDLPALGSWGGVHAGVALGTDAASYPTWSSVAAVSLPVGTAFEWKLTAGPDGGAVRWEQGGNRRGLAGPAALLAAGALELSGTWR
jgi:Starch binding domain/PLD-like domain